MSNINQAHKNLVLTEEAIKSHSKRMKKELAHHQLDLSLCETQNLFAKALGFNNFHELKNILNHYSNSSPNLKKIIFILSESDTICQTTSFFIKNLMKEHECTYFQSVSSLEEYQLKNQKIPHLIIMDESFVSKIEIKDSINVLLLHAGNKLDDTINNLFHKKEYDTLISYLKDYINEHLGQVDKKYWLMLLSIYKQKNEQIEFEKIALRYQNTIDLNSHITFESFHDLMFTNNYFVLNKPFSKYELRDTLEFILK